MTISVTHAFVSAIPDDPTAAGAGEVVPSNWNAGHVVTGAVADSRQVLAGTGLTGGGALTSDLTFGLSASTSATLAGALQSGNNLSDVANAATARGNLAAAPLASPAFTGTPTAPTPAAGDSTTSLATTAFVSGAIRQRLTSNLTYFVSTTGSDSNNGLTSGTAFLTLQHAYNVIAGTLDLGGKTVTIQLADGTYAGGLAVSGSWTGGGAITVNGNMTTPDNVVINSSSYAIINQIALPGILTIQNMKLTTSANDGIRNTGSGIIVFNNIDFGPVGGFHIAAVGVGAAVQAGAPYTISGSPSGTVHAFCQTQGQIFIRGVQVTLGPSRLQWSAGFAYATGGLALIAANSATYVGAQTITMTIASPAVVTWNAHGLSPGDAVVFNTSGALPTGVTAGTTYYVLATGLTGSSFEFSTTAGGAAVNTSGSQSGTQNAFSANGNRYYADTNSVIYTNGGGANFLPGNAAGSVGTGGQYA